MLRAQQIGLSFPLGRLKRQHWKAFKKSLKQAKNGGDCAANSHKLPDLVRSIVDCSNLDVAPSCNSQSFVFNALSDRSEVDLALSFGFVGANPFFLSI